MEHMFFLVHLHHRQQTVTIKVLGSKMQWLYPDLWKSRVYAAHCIDIIGTEIVYQNNPQMCRFLSYKTNTTTLGGVALPHSDFLSDEMYAASQGGKSPPPAAVSKWNLVFKMGGELGVRIRCRITYINALNGLGSVPKRLSRIKQLSRSTEVGWLLPDPYQKYIGH